MKFYTIAMLIFLFSLSSALITEIDVMGSYKPSYQKDWIDSVNSDSFKNQSYDSAGLEDAGDTSTDYGNFKLGLSVITKTLFYATIGFPWLLNKWGLGIGLAVLFSLPLWIVYIIALVQVFANRPFGGMR